MKQQQTVETASDLLAEARASARSLMNGTYRRPNPRVTPGLRIEGERDKAGISTHKFGEVTFHSVAPDPETVAKNIEFGRNALIRSKDAFMSSGIVLKLATGVPKFRVDENDTRFLIREVDGQVQRGRIIEGRFEPEE